MPLKTKPSTFMTIRPVLLSEHTCLRVLMITWHQCAAIFHWRAYKQ